MPCTAGKFKPLPHETVVLGNQKYVVQAHPSAPAMPFAAEGRRAVVYSLIGPGNHSSALKVFRKTFRTPDLLDAASLAARFEHLPGMLAAKRIVFGPSDRAAIDCPDLLYSALMPWIAGITWNDMLLRAERGGPAYGLDPSLRLCARFLEVMTSLENASITHTDIASGNVMMDLRSFDVQLLDLEDLYVPGSPAPKTRNTGTPGYRHASADETQQTTYCPEGDRYATAIMAAEILLLSNPLLPAQSNDNGYFGGNRTTPIGTQRFHAAGPYLQSIAPQFAPLFEAAWLSPTLDACPRASELLATVSGIPVTPLQSPQTSQTTVAGVMWQPLPAQRQQSSQSVSSSPFPAQASQSANPSYKAVSWSHSATTSAAVSAPPVPPPQFGQSNPNANTTQSTRWIWITLAILVVLGLIVSAMVIQYQHSQKEQERAEQQRRMDQQQIEQLEQEKQKAQQAEEDSKKAQAAEAARRTAEAASNLERQHAQDQEREREHQLEEDKLKAQAEVLSKLAKAADEARRTTDLNSQAGYIVRYENWLRKRDGEMGSNTYKVFFVNDCPNTTVQVVVRFKVPDDSGHWVTLGWWKIDPGKNAKPLIVTDDPNIYFYAEGGTMTWNGDGKPGRVTSSIVDEGFVYEDGGQLRGTNRKNITMRHLLIDSYGEHPQPLTCH